MTGRRALLDLPPPPRHVLPYRPERLVTAIVTQELLDDVLEVLARHGEHPPADRTAAWLDRLLLDTD